MLCDICQTLGSCGGGGLCPEYKKSALDIQISGDHYKDMPIQPAQYIHANAMGYFEGNVVKYVSRWRKKNGIADLEKAKHYIDLLIQLETERSQLPGV
jgi:hypothetical protein